MGQRLRAKGVKVKQADIAYEFTTKDVEAYIQEIFNSYLINKRNELKAKGIKLGYELPKRIDNIQVRSANIAKKRTVFMVALPLETLYSEVTKMDNVPSIFSSEVDNDDEVKLIPEIATFWKMYAYNEFDKEQLKNNRFIQQQGLTRREADTMIHYIEPRIKVYNNRRQRGDEGKSVVFLLDPFRLFYVMIAGENEKVDMENPHYSVRITDVKKISNDGLHKFTIKRTSNKGNKNNKGERYNLGREIDSLFGR